MAKKGYFSAENFTRRELPSGYTQVLYIESSGTQYIDTGFKANQDTKVVMRAAFTNLGAHDTLFGGRTSANSKAYALTYTTAGGNYYRYFYNTEYTSTTLTGDPYKTQVIVADKNKISIGDSSYSWTYGSFQCDYTMYLLAGNEAGIVNRNASAKLYYCQIYDNGTLIRDYVPCLNPSGTAGLYDMVNGVFYGNAGTGSFLTGDEVHSDVAREPKKVYFSVNGVAWKAKKAYFGDENGIAREWFSSGLCVGELAVGSSVFMNVGGVRTEFLIVHQGNPSTTYYDNSCSGTWLLMKNIYTKKVSGSKTYTDSTINTYLNGDFLALLDSGVANAIKSVKIPYGVVSDGNLTSKHGSNGALVKVFILSLTEVGFTSDSGVADFNGSALSYFKGIGNGAATKRTAYYNGTADHWFSRTPNKYASGTLYRFVYSTGALGNGGGEYNSYGVRPALVLPSSTGVDEHFNVIA